MAACDRDVGKLLKEVESVLSARDRQCQRDIRDRDTDIANLRQKVNNLNGIVQHREDQARSLKDELDRLMISQRRELQAYNEQLDELRNKHVQLLQTHSDAKAKHTKRYEKVVKQRDKLTADLSARNTELLEQHQQNTELEEKLRSAQCGEKEAAAKMLSAQMEMDKLSDRCSAHQASSDRYKEQAATSAKKLDDTKRDHTKRVRDLETRIKSVRDDSNKNIESIRKALEKQQEVTKSITEENIGYRRQLAERCTRFEHMELDNGALRDEVKLLQKQIKTAQTDCCQHRERVEQLLTTVDRQQTHIDDLEATDRQLISLELTAVREELGQAQNQISQLEQNEDHLRQLLAEADNRHSKCVTDSATLRADLKHALSEVTSFQQMVLKCQQEHGHLTDKVRAAERLGKQKVKTQLDNLTIRLAEKQSEVLKHQQALAEAQQKNDQLSHDKKDFQRRFNAAVVEIDDLRQQLQVRTAVRMQSSDMGNPTAATLDSQDVPFNSSFRRLPSKINPAVVGLRPRDQARAGAAAAAGLTSSSTAVATTTTSSTARSSSDSLAGPLARGGEASDTISGMRAHEPTDASVVNQLLSELTDALAPPASLSTASAGLNCPAAASYAPASNTSVSSVFQQSSDRQRPGPGTHAPRPPTTGQHRNQTTATEKVDDFVADFLARNSIEHDVSRLVDSVTWDDLETR
eukprot:scpid33957/ scgid0085/ 